MLTRRNVLLVPVLGLAACAGLSPSTIAATAASDINLIGTGLLAALPGLKGVVSASALTEVTNDVNSIESIASSITTASTQAAGQSAVSQIESLVNAVVAALAGLSLPAPFGPALTAAEVLLPVVEVAVGLVATNLSAKRQVAPVGAMTPDQARAILRAGS